MEGGPADPADCADCADQALGSCVWSFDGSSPPGRPGKQEGKPRRVLSLLVACLSWIANDLICLFLTLICPSFLLKTHRCIRLVVKMLVGCAKEEEGAGIASMATVAAAVSFQDQDYCHPRVWQH